MSKKLEKLARWYAVDGGALPRFHRLVMWAQLLGPNTDVAAVLRWVSLANHPVDREFAAALRTEGPEPLLARVLGELRYVVDAGAIGPHDDSLLARKIYDFHDDLSFAMMLDHWERQRGR